MLPPGPILFYIPQLNHEESTNYCEERECVTPVIIFFSRSGAGY